MSETFKVATTMRPHEEIEVSEAEAIDLLRQGVVATLNGMKPNKKEGTGNGGNVN